MYLLIFAAIVILVVVGATVVAGGKSSTSDSLVGTAEITVVNEDGQRIPNASLSINNTYEHTTDAQGVWRGSVPESIYLVVSAATGVADPAQYIPYRGSPELVAGKYTVVLKGYSSLSPWGSLLNAVNRLPNGDTTCRITYSFIPSGVHVSSDPEGTSIVLADHFDNSLTTQQFKAEIIAAFSAWKKAIEAAFNTSQGYAHNLTMEFDEVTETESPPLFGQYEEHYGGTGAFRIGMWSMDGNQQILAYAYGPNNSPSNAAGDMLFNSTMDWRLDNDVSDIGGDGGYSVMYVAVHEIGHALGLGHHVLQESVMAPTAGRSLQFIQKFPHGLQASTYERAALQGIYA